MDVFLEWVIAGIIIIIGTLLTVFDLPGNTLLLLTGFGFAFYDEAVYFNSRLLTAMVFVYAVGEAWEFCVSVFGIKRHKVSWSTVFLIGSGGFIGTAIGTAVLPVFGSFIGGIAGAFSVAFLYEYLRSGRQHMALAFAYEAAKVRFLALIGKMAAGILLSILLFDLVFLNRI